MSRATALKNRIIKNTLISFLSGGFVALIGFFLIPYMIFRLGTLEFGLILIARIFFVEGIAGLLLLGIREAIVKHSAAHNVKSNDVVFVQLFYASLFVSLLIGVIALVIGLSLVNVFVENVFKIPVNYSTTFTNALYIIFISYIFQFPERIVTGFFEGIQRVDIVKTVEAVSWFGIALFSVILIESGYGVFEIIALHVVFLFIRFIYYLSSIIFIKSSLKNPIFTSSFSVLPLIYGLAKYSFVSNISNRIYYEIDRIAVSVFLGPTIMSFYEVLMKIPRFLKSLLGTISITIMPATSEMDMAGNRIVIRKIFLRTWQITMFGAFPLVTGTMFFASDILDMWVGKQFVQLSTMMQIMLVWVLLSLINFVWSMLFASRKHLGTLVKVSWFNTIFKLIFAFGLVYSIGLWAIVLGSLGIVFTAPVGLALGKRQFLIETRELVRDIVILLSSGLILVIIFTSIHWLWASNSITAVLIQVIGWWIIGWIILYFAMLSNESRRIIKDICARILLLLMPQRLSPSRKY